MAASSNHPHKWTSLGKIEAGLVAISGYEGDTEVEESTVEMYTNEHWVQQPPFPEKNGIYGYSTATYENVLYVFGEYNFRTD